jgi:hypothetical protein
MFASRPSLPSKPALPAPTAATRREWLRRSLWLGFGLPAASTALSGCAWLRPDAGTDEEADAAPAHRLGPEFASSAWARSSLVEGASGEWEHQTFLGRSPTQYRATEHQGRPAVHALCEGNNSLLRRRVQLPTGAWGALSFGWWVDALNPQSNLTDRDSNDAVARIILTFDGNRQGFTARDLALSELALLLTGEPMPHATLMYVWDNKHPVGTVLQDPNTSRVRLLVARSGPSELGRWSEEVRDVQADYARAFGDSASQLTGIGLMTDSNNTRQRSEAWYGPLNLKRRTGS